MIGAILGAATSIGSSIYGGIKAHKAEKKYRKEIADLNKKQNDLAKIFGKFRRCTIDRKDQIFAELAALVKQ